MPSHAVFVQRSQYLRSLIRDLYEDFLAPGKGGSLGGINELHAITVTYSEEQVADASHSLRSSLMPVFARVWASTVFTITAQ